MREHVNRNTEDGVSGTPGEKDKGKRARKKLPAELIECAHRHGIQGRVVWIPTMKMNNIRKQLAHYVLLMMEDAYEKFGYWPRTKDDVRKRFPTNTVSGFSRYEDMTYKQLHDARLEARRRFLDWYIGSRKKNPNWNPEQQRINQVRKHANSHMLSDVHLIQAYRDIRAAIRKGEMIPQMEVPDHSVEFLKLVAKESVDVPWRRGL